MNDEPPVRLRPRKSKHGPNDNPRKYIGVLRSMLRLVQMSKRPHETRSRYLDGGSARAPRTFNQRVAVRVNYSANKNPGQWKAHGTYVARESATQGGRAAEAGFNATDQKLDIATTLNNWQSAGDERLFKIIVSPEFADRLNLQKYARELTRKEGRFAWRGNIFVRACAGGLKKSLPKPWAIAPPHLLKRRNAAK